MKLHHLTNEELVNQLTLRSDLTDVEHELLDRLIRAMTALDEQDNSGDSTPPAGEDDGGNT